MRKKKNYYVTSLSSVFCPRPFHELHLRAKGIPSENPYIPGRSCEVNRYNLSEMKMNPTSFLPCIEYQGVSLT